MIAPVVLWVFGGLVTPVVDQSKATPAIMMTAAARCLEVRGDLARLGGRRGANRAQPALSLGMLPDCGCSAIAHLQGVQLAAASATSLPGFVDCNLLGRTEAGAKTVRRPDEKTSRLGELIMFMILPACKFRLLFFATRRSKVAI